MTDQSNPADMPAADAATADTAAAVDPAMPFETALAELEKIVRALEAGEASLDQSVALYARGQALRAFCDARLNAAEARIEQVTTDTSGGATGTKPFDTSGA